MKTLDPILEELTQEPIPPLLKDDGQPIFRDSWEAEAFAIGNLLIKQGFLSCSEWVNIFSEEIKKAQVQGDPDRGDTYYSHWLNALERLCIERGLTDWQTYQKQLQLWHQAVLNTPHGVPLAIENAYLETDDNHDHHDHSHHHRHHHHHHSDKLPENMLKPVAVFRR
ncbi:MAG: nitrile hydratase accessory protein [Snowella sp.]